MTIINCTPHEIKLNTGETFPVSGNIARVKVTFSNIIDGICHQEFGEIENLPMGTCQACGSHFDCGGFAEKSECNPEKNLFIVSGIVLAANNASKNPRTDLVAPATGHPDTIRNNKGHIVSVPCFVK